MSLTQTINIITKTMSNTNQLILRNYVQQNLEKYFSNLDGHKPSDLYAMVLKEIEIPLIQFVLKHTKNNQSQAANILGISRGTLRKKLQELKEFF